MTLETFLEHLAATKTTRKWQAERYAYDRPDSLPRLRTPVPAAVNDILGVCECPVTAVAHHLGHRRTYNRPFSPGLYTEAALVLGIERKLADDIVGAADGMEGDEYTTLRGQLFEAVGLTGALVIEYPDEGGAL